MSNVSTDGVPKVSRIGRMLMADKATVRRFFEAQAARGGDVAAIVMAHGNVVSERCDRAFTAIAASLA